MLTANARARASACALARRARAWTLAYAGMAIAARMPMIATTIINSIRVKPFCTAFMEMFLEELERRNKRRKRRLRCRSCNPYARRRVDRNTLILLVYCDATNDVV